MKKFEFPWSVKLDPSLRAAYHSARTEGNAERLRAVAALALTMFSLLAVQHALSPGVRPSSPFYCAFFAAYGFFILSSAAYILLDRFAFPPGGSAPAQYAYVACCLAGTAFLAVVDTLVNIDRSALLVGLMITAVFFRAGPAAFALSVCAVLAAFAAGTTLLDAGQNEVNLYVIMGVDFFVALGLSLVLGGYDVKAFLLKRELERANATLREDVSAQEGAARKLGEALREGDLMFRELQHRVKNSLSMAASFLALEERRLPEGDARGALARSRGRIEAMSAAYTMLYRTRETESLDFSVYAADLVRALAGANEALGVRVVAELGRFRIDAKRAILLGLAMNELVTNACKHAFPGDRGGAVRVEAGGADGGAFLRVSDDGVGLADAAGGGFGNRIIALLAEQLGASIERPAGEGTSVELRFPL